MQSDDLRTARDTVLGLLAEQKAFLGRIESTPDLLKDSLADQVARTLDRETARRVRETLENETGKVERLEMVLAVVGTMKAGKSTTINAIVGTEILPNRNQPMTTLPTLIRHRSGQAVPVLHFPKPGPLLTLAAQVREALHEVQQAKRLNEITLFSEPDGRGLIERLLSGAESGLVRDSYHGQEHIFAFLKELNDLLRLARDPLIDLNPPFDEYDAADELPVIEVEFFHLRNSQALQQGNFSLLDTPGPNESGQSVALRRILREQLAKASAVLAVLDYTQLKSEAEAEIRDDLGEIAEQTEDRLFVLVNKFDQVDRHSLDEEETRDHVAVALMEGRLDRNRIFPASSRNAYLANRARQEIDRTGYLPSPRAQAWVADFAKLALGVAWQRDLHSGGKIRTAARDLWASSRFDVPIRQVVVKAAAQAAGFSVKAALAKMFDCDRRVDAFLMLRRGSLSQDVDQLKALIAGLEQDISSLDRAQTAARQEAFGIVGFYGLVVNQLQASLRDALVATLARYFKTGSINIDFFREEQARLLGEAAERLRADSEALSSIFGFVFEGAVSNATVVAGVVFDPVCPVLRFETEPAARRFANRITGPIQTLVDDTARTLERKLTEAADVLESCVAGAIRTAVGEILAKAQQRLEHQGFNIQVHFPDPELEGIGVEFSEIAVAGISQHTQIRKGRKETGSILGKVGRWWKGNQSEWGYQTSTYHEVVHQVSVDRIRDSILESLRESGIAKNRIEEYVTTVLEPKLLEYFRDLKNYLESFRGILRDGIDDHQRKQKSLHELRFVIGELAEVATRHFKEVQRVKEWVDQLPPPPLEALAPEQDDALDEHGDSFSEPLGGRSGPAGPVSGGPVSGGPVPGGAGRTSDHGWPAPPPPQPPPPAYPAAMPGFGAPSPPPGFAGYTPPPGGFGEHEADETISEATLSGGAEATLIGQMFNQARPTLEVEYGGRKLSIDGAFGKILIGRGSDCQLVVSGRRASRHHAHISAEYGTFVLTDTSTNGTFVQYEDGERKVVNHASERLKPAGMIGLGLEPGRDPEHTIVFRQLRRE